MSDPADTTEQPATDAPLLGEAQPAPLECPWCEKEVATLPVEFRGSCGGLGRVRFCSERCREEAINLSRDTKLDEREPFDQRPILAPQPEPPAPAGCRPWCYSVRRPGYACDCAGQAEVSHCPKHALSIVRPERTHPGGIVIPALSCEECAAERRRDGDRARTVTAILEPIAAPTEPPSNAGQDGYTLPPVTRLDVSAVGLRFRFSLPSGSTLHLYVDPDGDVGATLASADQKVAQGGGIDWPAPSEPAKAPEPIAMRLPCPGCGTLHIDEGEFATKPHHTHSCQACGLTWRPAVVHTVGVQFLPGFKNESPPPAPQREASAATEKTCGFHGCVRLVVDGKHDGRHFAEGGYFDDEPATAKDTWLPLGKHPGGECALWCGSVVMGCPPEKEGAHYGGCFSVNGEPCLCSAYCNRRYRAARPERRAAGEPDATEMHDLTAQLASLREDIAQDIDHMVVSRSDLAFRNLVVERIRTGKPKGTT